MSLSVRPRTFRTPGGRMRYTDVGDGPPVVLVHGNPTSARLYRSIIAALAPDYRCIAPDHLGFGRSEAPPEASYRPTDHATRLHALLHHLDLHNLTLVMHDWGGPIGLSYALHNPDRIRRLILTNTWAWPLLHRPLIRIFSALVRSTMGQLLIERGNAFARLVMPLTLGTRSLPLPPWIDAYARALDTLPRRHACWTFARSLTKETAWLRSLWSHRSRLNAHSALLCWGMTDPAFGTEPTLRRWQRLLPKAEVHRWPNVGHYLPEEVAPAFTARVQAFLRSTAL